MRVLIYLAIVLALSADCIAQSTDKISQIIASENYFAALAKEKGIKKAFLKVSDNNTIVFRPEPVSAIDHYKEQGDSLGHLFWEPVYARIAKSADWGFTTGPYTFKEDSAAATRYGQYVSIWKKNSKGVWKLAIDLGVPHKKPVAKPLLNFPNPANEVFLKQRSQTRLQQREDIVLSSDKLYVTVQKADNALAQKEFLSDESRLLFPGFEPIVGKKAIMNFWQKQGLKASSQVKAVDRSLSGELAYTQGETTIVQKQKIKKYHYIRIWEVQPGYKWNVILEIYGEAGEPKLEARN